MSYLRALIVRKSIFLVVIATLFMSFWVGRTIDPVYFLETITLDVHNQDGRSYYIYKDEPSYIDNVVHRSSSLLLAAQKSFWEHVPESAQEVVVSGVEDGQLTYDLLVLKRHWSFWSLLPACLTLFLCWFTREPVTALLAGIFSGAFLLGKYNLLEEILIPSLMSKNAATIILIYMFLLGGLLGLWSKTGAARAFAEWMATHFVRGPRSAKLVTWFLGILFFQGGTLSVVLVGSTVKPMSDRERVSHEELAYIVDSTASPIASQLAFNAWPAYVQSFIYVTGVSFLATEADRIAFFFKSVPFCFYAIFAVLGTFLVAIEKPFFFGKDLEAAMKRSRSTGELDVPHSVPLSSPELEHTEVPEGYRSHILDFVLPLVVLIGTVVTTFVLYGSPNIVLAFGLAIVFLFLLSVAKGMTVPAAIDGVVDGMKSLVLGLVILLCAMFIGQITISTGAGLYLTEVLGDQIPYWILPVVLQLMCVCMAFSTGTSWGTYAVVFPVAMPLAWGVATYAGVAHPELFMTICFAAVMDGAVFGDQCSPISDTTVLSSMCTGCDLIDPSENTDDDPDSAENTDDPEETNDSENFNGLDP